MTATDTRPQHVATSAPAPSASRRRRSTGSVLLDVVLVVLGLLMITPLVWLVVTSITRADRAFSVPPTWLPRPSWQNFRAVPGLIPFARMALNSLVIAVVTTYGALLTSVLAAYAFSRLSFRGRDAIFLVLLSALMVPTQLTVIPLYVLMRNLHLINTLPSVWLPAIVNVFGIFFLRQYFQSIPRDLDEAARIDGAGHLWILFRMLVPLSSPALTALAIFVFEASWNNFFGPLIFLQTPNRMTLPVGIIALSSGQNGSGSPAVVFAAVTMVVVPILVLFLVFQRSFVASIATTGLRS